MIYISIDIETTGIDPLQDQILEFAAIIVDTSKDIQPENRPRVKWTVYTEDRLSGSPYALKLNSRLLDQYVKIETGKNHDPYVYVDLLAENFRAFLGSNGFKFNNNGAIHFIAAGKNYAGFDNLFLNQVSKWKKLFKGE